MERKSSGLSWAIGALLLILASIGAFRAGQHSPAVAKVPAPCYVNIGNLSAYAGGKRLVKATVVVEAVSEKSQEIIMAAIPGAKDVVIRSFAEISEQRIETVEGKRELQILIQGNLDRLFGAHSIREVLFTSFLMSIS